MRIFVLWQLKDPTSPTAVSPGAPTPTSVAAALLRRFGPLFEPAPTAHERTFGTVGLAWIDLPVKGFRPPFVEQHDGRFALAAEYPLNARRLLRGLGRTPVEGRVLLQLHDAFEADRQTVVREMVPPGALVYGDDRGAVVHNDGLGQAQLLEYEDDRIYALTNRLHALPTVGVEVRPVADDWAVRMVTGWFPGNCSGYRGIGFVPGGTRIDLRAGVVQRSRVDPVGSWVCPPPMSRQDALELGHHAMMRVAADAVEVWDRPSVGLSGGWDSRAVVSCLRVLGADVDLRVRGAHTNVDVMIAAELARMAAMPIRIKEGGGLPSDTVEGCRRCVQKALLWQGGMYTTLKHKNFLARAGKETMDGGVVNVMGQHGGLGKADFARKIAADTHPEAEYEQRLLEQLLADAPVYLRSGLREPMRERLRQTYRAAGQHGLRGHHPLHYFFLNEYTRRWGSATVNGQTGVVVAPFLSPDMIRACYALPPAELMQKPVHRFVTERNAPDWARFPYEDQVTEDDLRSGRIPALPAPRSRDKADLPEWRALRRRHKFGYRSYWRTMAFPLIEEAFANGGFWTEIFDADLARAHWLDQKTGGDLITLLYLL